LSLAPATDLVPHAAAARFAGLLDVTSSSMASPAAEGDGESTPAPITEAIAPSESAWSSVFTLANTAIGVGVLSFPFAYRLTGLAGGSALCLVVAALEHFTLVTLVRAAARYKVVSYQAVVHRAFGRMFGRLAAIILSSSLVVYLYGSLVAYLILLGDVSTSLVTPIAGEGSIWSERWIGICVPAFVLCLPLCLTRSLGAISGMKWCLLGLSCPLPPFCLTSCTHSSDVLLLAKLIPETPSWAVGRIAYTIPVCFAQSC